MSDDDNAVPASRHAVPEAGNGWSPQDSRTLIVTIGGGLIVNPGTVILVAAAIAFVRCSRISQTVPWLMFASLVFIAGGVLMIFMGNFVRLGRVFEIPLEKKRPPWLGWLLIVLGSLGLLEGVLILTGLAAGVK